MTIYVEKKDGIPTGNLIVEIRKDGKVIKRRAPNAKEAKRLEKEILAGNIVRKADRGVDTSAATVGTMARDARDLWRGNKDSAQSQRQLDVVCSIIGHDILLRDLCTAHIDKLVVGLRVKGLSDTTINRYMAVVSKVLQWAYDRDYIIKLPRLTWHPEPKTRFSWLKDEDEKRLVEWLEDTTNLPTSLYRSAKKRKRPVGPTMAIVVKVLTITGLRIGELLKAKPEDVDIEGEALKLWDPETIKTGKPRTQYLPKALAARLRAEMEVGLPDYDTLTHAFYAARKALQLDPELKLHSLRHTTATRLALKDVNHRVIMEYMGHRSMATTNRYTHVSHDAKRQAARLLVGASEGEA